MLSVAKNQVHNVVEQVKEQLGPKATIQHAPLPPQCAMTMNLVFNKSAPYNYQAPGFISAEPSTVDVIATMNNKNKSNLTVATPFHRYVQSFRLLSSY